MANANGKILRPIQCRPPLHLPRTSSPSLHRHALSNNGAVNLSGLSLSMFSFTGNSGAVAISVSFTHLNSSATFIETIPSSFLPLQLFQTMAGFFPSTPKREHHRLQVASVRRFDEDSVSTSLQRRLA